MNSKRKGTRAEREAASFLRENGFSQARRGQQYAGSPESPDLVGVPGWHLEVKRTERFKLRDAVAQTEGDSGGRRWAILHRWNFGKWLVVLQAEDWLALVRETLPPQTAPSTDLGQTPPAPSGAPQAESPQTKNEEEPHDCNTDGIRQGGH